MKHVHFCADQGGTDRLVNWEARIRIFSSGTTTMKHQGRTWVLAWVFILWAAFSYGQSCDLACNGTPDAPLQAAVNQGCMITLVPDAILEAPQQCPGPKEMTVRNAASVIIAQGIDLVSFDGDPYLGQVFSVTVKDTTTGIFCVGFIRVVDNLAPAVASCPEVSVDCVAATDTASIGRPVFTDNCSGALQLSFADQVVPGDCLGPNVRIINRTWTARDAGGNTATCVQVINMVRPDLEDVVFPANVSRSCENPSAATSITGVPVLADTPIQNGDICGLTVTMSDDTIFLCGNLEYQILRTWTVTDLCSGFDRTAVQVISIADDVAPQITCPPAVSVNTATGQCSATVTLAAPTVSDNCDATPEYFVNTSYGAVGLGPHPFVPAGTHTVQYTATDECGNTSVCTTTVTVVDNEQPVAVCEDMLIVSVPTGGMAKVKATSFDDGSFDNCGGTVYFKVIRMQLGDCIGANGDDSEQIPGYQEWFDDDVYFCCEDIGNTNLRVTMRVYAKNPGPGPVDPTREQPGGDLYGFFSECMITVTVQDKLPPTLIDCPANVTIDCRDDYTDLSIFGTPHFTDNCGYTVDSTATVDIDDCGVGTIIRKFTARDGTGLEAICIQQITVVNQHPFSASQIIWPQDYTTDICGSSTDPADLPDGYDEPVITGESCGIIAKNYVDNIFDTAPPACYKILRTWTVLDWCVYDPDNPGSGGRFTKTQIIKVQDNVKPVITCPESVTVSVSNDCATAQVILPPATATDCSPNVLITNNSSYANNGGANVSGTYPLGSTIVTLTASDRCGNTASCQVTVTVKDQKVPSPLCIVGLSASLYEQNGEFLTRVAASAFDGGSSDNCTPANLLKRQIRRAAGNNNAVAPANELVFDCEDIGTQLVELWVTDQVGNSAFCLTYLSVQDNAGLCPNTTAAGMIAGSITTEEGENVDKVTVQVTGGSFQEMVTGDDGAFEFPDIPLGDDYTILPKRNQDPLNGVTTIDLVLISKHILGIQRLDSPYKIIAADVDRSGGVSTLDMIRLRKLILHIDDQLPNGNQSWRFVDAGFVFPNPQNPFATYFPEFYNVTDFEDAAMYANFIAIKVGDVNFTAIPNSLVGMEERTTFGEMTFFTENRRVQRNDEFTVEMRARAMDTYAGYQFTLFFDPDVLEFIRVEEGEAPDMNVDNFGLTKLNDGLITTSWNEVGTARIGEETALFSLKFRAKADGELSDLLQINSRLTPAEAYTREGEPRNVKLEFLDAGGSRFELQQNRPNPFRDQTTIGFSLPGEEDVYLTVFDPAGKMVYQQQAHFGSGYNEMTVMRNNLPTAGIFYYTVEAGKWKETRKMILLDQ